MCMTYSPFPEMLTLGELKFHPQLWLSSAFIDRPSEKIFSIAVLNDLDYEVPHFASISA